MWLLIGGDGWIGKQLQNELIAQNIEYQCSSERMDNPIDKLEQEIKNLDVDRVICLAGRTSGGQYNTIDYLELGKQQTLENVRTK